MILYLDSGLHVADDAGMVYLPDEVRRRYHDPEPPVREPESSTAEAPAMSEFIYCLNTSTIRPTPLLEKIRIAGAAGYQAIEPWNDEVDRLPRRRAGRSPT